MSEAERQTAGAELRSVETTLSAAEPDRMEVAGAVGRFIRMFPWAGPKFSELATGAAGSILGAGVIAGVKFALGLL